VGDKEATAIATVADALESLEDDSRQRVVDYILARFAPDQSPLGTRAERTEEQHEESTPLESNSTNNLPEFFDQVNPGSESERALAVGYWLQYHQEESGFQAEKINSELNQLGQKVSNISRALKDNVDANPSRIMQTGKQGDGKQGRKSYRLTEAGKRRIESML
jgi:hypothetical protein